MSKPVGVYADSTLSLGRRTVGGLSLTIPSPEVVQLFEYLALYYSIKHKVPVWCLMLMSNHYHASADQKHPNYPAFLRDFNGKFAFALRALLRKDPKLTEAITRLTAVWDSRPPMRALTPEPEKAWEYALYSATNPCRAGICPDSSHWPGTIFTPANCGQKRIVKRPAIIEELYTNFPESISYTVPKPHHMTHLTEEEIRKRFDKERRQMDQEIAAQRDKPFLSVDRAMEQSRLTLPKDPPELTAPPLFLASPEVRKQLWAQRKAFLKHYDKAHEALQEGQIITWPKGTWARRVYDKVPT